jgi:hypothetical protein
VLKHAVCLFRCDKLTSLVHFVVQQVLRIKCDPDATKVRLDDRKGLFNRVIVWQIRRKIFNTAPRSRVSRGWPLMGELTIAANEIFDLR